MTMTDDSYADVVERLFRDFEDRHPLWMISDVVAGCRSELDAQTAAPARSEMIERLARQRLLDMHDRYRGQASE